MKDTLIDSFVTTAFLRKANY